MIVLSGGMPKAGTGYYFNLTNDLLIVSGGQDIRRLREKYDLGAILKHIIAMWENQIEKIWRRS